MQSQRDHLWAVSGLCVGCGSCEEACRLRHGAARLRRPTHALPVTFPDVCQHCGRPACVESCIAGSLRKDAETGRVVHDRDRCVGCWSCIMACPFGAVRRDLVGREVSVRCDRCAGFRGLACVVSCPTGALRTGGDAALAAEISRPRSVLARPLRAVALLAVPLLGLGLGLARPAWAMRSNHPLGIAAGGLVAVSLLLSLIGRPLWPVISRAIWTRWHLWTGALAAGVVMVHAAGRFGLNAQTLAAFSLLGLLLTGVAYRYLRPIHLFFEAVLMREAAPAAAAEHPAAADDDHPRVAAAAAGAWQARAWAAWLRRIGAALAACRTVHIALAIVAVGLVVAHVVLMTIIGGQRP